MSSKYKFIDSKGVYFTTSTLVGWIDLFTRDVYRNIVLDSLRYCQQHQGLQIHAWVMMTNHIHLICSAKEGNELGQVLRNFKSFTAMKLIDAIVNNPKESRKEWMLDLMEKYGKQSISNHRFQCWQHENQPFLLDSTLIYMQRLNYTHYNPVTAGFVTEPYHWKYSSANEYFNGITGLLPLIILE